MYQKLVTEKRVPTEINNRDVRKKGMIPAVIFGKEANPSLAIQLPANKLHKFLASAGRVFELEVKGGETHLVNLDHLQWDALGNRVLHASFHKLKKGQKTRVSLQITLVGEAKGLKDGGVVAPVISEVEIEALPKDIPASLEVDISELGVDETLSLKDIKLPSALTLLETDLEKVIVSCQRPKQEAEETQEAASPEDTPTVAEGEAAQQEASAAAEKAEKADKAEDK